MELDQRDKCTKPPNNNSATIIVKHTKNKAKLRRLFNKTII